MQRFPFVHADDSGNGSSNAGATITCAEDPAGGHSGTATNLKEPRNARTSKLSGAIQEKEKSLVVSKEVEEVSKAGGEAFCRISSMSPPRKQHRRLARASRSITLLGGRKKRSTNEAVTGSEMQSSISNAMARKRLLRDFRSLQNDPPTGISGCPVDERNIFVWQALVFGPDDTPWQGGVFHLRLYFPRDYPHRAPKVYFDSTVFHPNVYADGRVCLDLLDGRWSPAYTVCSILTSVQSLLCDPNPDNAANPTAASLYMKDRIAYNLRVSRIVKKSWRDAELENETEGSHRRRQFHRRSRHSTTEERPLIKNPSAHNVAINHLYVTDSRKYHAKVFRIVHWSLANHYRRSTYKPEGYSEAEIVERGNILCNMKQYLQSHMYVGAAGPCGVAEPSKDTITIGCIMYMIRQKAAEWQRVRLTLQRAENGYGQSNGEHNNKPHLFVEPAEHQDTASTHRHGESMENAHDSLPAATTGSLNKVTKEPRADSMIARTAAYERHDFLQAVRHRIPCLLLCVPVSFALAAFCMHFSNDRKARPLLRTRTIQMGAGDGFLSSSSSVLILALMLCPLLLSKMRWTGRFRAPWWSSRGVSDKASQPPPTVML